MNDSKLPLLVADKECSKNVEAEQHEEESLERGGLKSQKFSLRGRKATCLLLRANEDRTNIDLEEDDDDEQIRPSKRFQGRPTCRPPWCHTSAQTETEIADL